MLFFPFFALGKVTAMLYSHNLTRNNFILLLHILIIAVFCSCQSSTEKIDTAASEYVVLSLRIDKHSKGFVDAYTGSEVIKESIENEPLTDLAVLQEDAENLLQRLNKLNESSGRAEFIKKQVTAAHTYIRQLRGEKFTLLEEARLLYDIEPAPVPENQYDDTIKKIDSLFPGKGKLWEKLSEFQKPLLLQEDELKTVLETCMEELRNRTKSFLPLPPDENVTLEFVTNKPWGGYNWFKGNSHSLIQINTDLPRNILQILHYASHEGYPGHHTDLTIKEQFFYKGMGYEEYSIFPLYAPQSVIAEGIAEAGMEVVFSEQEMLSFIKDVLLPMKGIAYFDLEKWNTIHKLLRTLSSVSGNAAILLFEEKKSEKEVTAYLQKYGLLSEESAQKRLEFIKTYRSYVFNYNYGYNLIKTYIEEGDIKERFKELITGHIYPSLLKK